MPAATPVPRGPTVLTLYRAAEAFRKGTWANRQEARGREMTAWRRAAAFLDGGVFCGGPAR